MIVSCIAIDDEPLALRLLCNFIEQTPFLKLTGKFDSSVNALKALHDNVPDLIFSDIQMPELNGMELARVIDQGSYFPKPRIIFTTAYNQFALEGYKVDALDYLLKPFNYEEFLRSAQKGLKYALLNQQTPFQQSEQEEENDYLFLKVEHQLVRISLNDILYIEGLKDYVKVWLNSAEKPVLSLISLKYLEEKLPVKRFMRIHRSFIVSLDKIHSITRGSVQIRQISITVGDQYKPAFSQFISKWA